MGLTAKQEKFCQGIADGSRYYVYQLIDPRDGSIFYIGKGNGNRETNHTKDAKADRIGNVAKHRRIKAILDSGLEVIARKVKTGMAEREALAMERDMIREKKSELTNILHGIVTNEEKIQEQARVMLKNMPPFELWVKYGRPGMVEVYEKLYGSARAMYDLIYGVTQDLANGR
jgi:hypothetical protein